MSVSAIRMPAAHCAGENEVGGPGKVWVDGGMVVAKLLDVAEEALRGPQSMAWSVVSAMWPAAGCSGKRCPEEMLAAVRGVVKDMSSAAGCCCKRWSEMLSTA